MGDNIYADTTNPNTMRRKYQFLAYQPGFQKLKQHTALLATWDDHDFGQNDAGAENPIKQESETIFLDFFDIPADADVRNYPGIYNAHILGPVGRQVQIILLDTRYFRGPLNKAQTDARCPKRNYVPQLDPDVSLLGESQWNWLAAQLQKPAQIRIIVSSIQVIPEQHCWEKWSNFPLEKKKLFDLIATSEANGVLFISGDRHLAEISKLEVDAIGYPLYEITSSGMNTKMYGKGELNRYRLTPENFRENNFGMIAVDWDAQKPYINLQLKSAKGKLLFQKKVVLAELTAFNSND